jgi:ankyrin repeat/BTB/POZ domain-containing protein 1
MNSCKMLLTFPSPSGDSPECITASSAPGEEGNSNQGNILDDLREKWLETEFGYSRQFENNT